MELSKKDRIFLINQYKILAALYPDESKHYEELISILDNGYQIFYSMVDEWVSEDMPEAEGRFVLDILNIYRIIEDIKRSSNNRNISDHDNSFFRGFDGNNETEYMAFARFLVIEQGKFIEQEAYLVKNDNMNSHSPMVENYKAMVQAWKSLGSKWKLSEEEALQILNA